MTDIQAAIGIKQLEKLDWIISERRKIAMKYNEAFKDMDYIQLPIEKEGYFTNFQSYIIYLKDSFTGLRNDLMQKLLDKGISTRRGIMATHTESAYSQYCQGLQLPITENVSDRSIILPLYVPMKADEIDYVIKCCSDLNIKYFLSYNTLLDSINNHTLKDSNEYFNINMIRDDYKILINYIRNNNKKYIVETCIDNKKYRQLVTTIISNSKKKITEVGPQYKP
jgi:hypothetical protein